MDNSVFLEVIHTSGVRQNADGCIRGSLQAAIVSTIIKEQEKKEEHPIAEHTEDLIGLLYKTIEQKNDQIQKLQEMVPELNATVANLNETIEEFRRKFFGTSSEKVRRREAPEEAAQEPETEGSTVRSHTRRKPKAKREELYEKLPVREIRCPIP